MKRRILLAVAFLFATSALSASPITIRVRDAATGAPLAAEVRLETPAGDGPVLTTDITGSIQFESPSAPFSATASASGYAPLKAAFDLSQSPVETITFLLDPLESVPFSTPAPGRGLFTGFVRDAHTLAPLEGAAIALASGGETAYTDAEGRFALAFIPPPEDADGLPGTDTLLVALPGYETLQLVELFLLPGTSRRAIDLAPGTGERIVPKTHKLLLARRGPLPDPADYLPEEPPIEPTPPEPPRDEPLPAPLLQVFDPPDTIRIGTDCSPCTTCPNVTVVSLETYVKGGIDNEWIGSWDFDSIAAGAIAVNPRPGPSGRFDSGRAIMDRRPPSPIREAGRRPTGRC